MVRKIKRGTLPNTTPTPKPTGSSRKMAVPMKELLEAGPKVDELLDVTQKIDYLKAKFANESGPLVARAKALEKELMSLAETNDVTSIAGDTAIATIKPSTSSTVDPKEFARLMKRVGTPDLVWEYLKVPVGKATSAFGKKVLEKEGVLSVTVKKYGRLKVTGR